MPFFGCCSGDRLRLCMDEAVFAVVKKHNINQWKKTLNSVPSQGEIRSREEGRPGMSSTGNVALPPTQQVQNRLKKDGQI